MMRFVRARPLVANGSKPGTGSRLLALVVAVAACAPKSLPRPGSPAGREGEMETAPIAASSKKGTGPISDSRTVAGSGVATEGSLLGAFDRGDLKRITITGVDVDAFPGCAPKTAPTWIVSSTDTKGDGATCIGDGDGAPTCVMFAGSTPAHLAEVMCTRRATAKPVDVPTWAQPVLATMRSSTTDAPWEITPVDDAVRPAVGIVVDMQLYVAIRTPEGWKRTTDAVEELMRLNVHRVIDTTSLTGATSYGVITSAYSGGSESGTVTKSLTVLRPAASGLELAGTIQLGQFTWVLAAEDRHRYPKGAGDMEARPHVDVQLAPRIEGDVLVLDIAREKITKELKGACKRSPEGDDLNAPCILVDMKAKAGRYKLVGLDFKRD